MTKVPKSTQDEMLAAVKAASDAFPSWSETTILTRQQIMFKFQSLIRENLVSLLQKFFYIELSVSVMTDIVYVHDFGFLNLLFEDLCNEMQSICMSVISCTLPI